MGAFVLTFQIKMPAALTRNLAIALDLASLAFVTNRGTRSEQSQSSKVQACESIPGI